MFPPRPAPTTTPTPRVTPTPDPDTSPTPPAGELAIVKRITAVNGFRIRNYRDVFSDPNDDPTVAWPEGASQFLEGAVDESVNPGDEVEFTLYFLANGSSTNLSICDPLPESVELSSDTITVDIDGTRRELSLSSDSDAGSFSDSPSRALCPISGPFTNGVIVVDLTQLTDGNAAGAIRFRVRIR
ncbi:MAG: DUF11 domain-containing protein [Synechococcaceae cyanobacterium SM2_3_1]|nr:DUF11 domain-containing protein [Synechococcaceae cyanobacterium SM2_3_1]